MTELKDIKKNLNDHLEVLIEKTKETKSTQELVSLSEQIVKVSSVLLSKNYY